MLPLAGSVAGIAGAATPDVRPAKLAEIGERLAVSSESDIRHWRDRLERGEAAPVACCGMSGRRRARDFGAGPGGDRRRGAPGAIRGGAGAGLPRPYDRRRDRRVIIDLAAAAGDLSLDTDICVIGGGAAGIAIAWYFRHIAGREVTVLEGGGIELDDASQDLNKGALSGKPYFDLDVTRLRMLGGNTNHWANQVAPFEDIDFEQRPWIAHSGWPIRRSDIDPWYPGALECLQLGREDLADYLNWGADVPALAAIDPPGGWSCALFRGGAGDDPAAWRRRPG